MFLYEDIDHTVLERRFEDLNVVLDSMRDDERLVDLQFVCRDEKKSGNVHIINAHQAIFSQLSALLKDLFQANKKVSHERIVISLDSVGPLIVEKLIEYVYHGSTVVHHKEQHELRDLCELLDIDLPAKYFDAQVPCPILGAIKYEEVYENNGDKPTTFLAEFPDCNFYDLWKSQKIDSSIFLPVNTFNICEDWLEEDPKAKNEIEAIVMECVSNAISLCSRSSKNKYVASKRATRNTNRSKNSNDLQQSNKNLKYSKRKALRNLEDTTQIPISVNIDEFPSGSGNFLHKIRRLPTEGRAKKKTRAHMPSRVIEPPSDGSNQKFQKRLKICLERIDSSTKDNTEQAYINNGESSLIDIAMERNKSLRNRCKVVRSSTKGPADKSFHDTLSERQEILYCLCRKPYNKNQRGMIGCDFCDEWFHPHCLSLCPDEVNILTERTWQCPLCEANAK